MRSTVIVEVEWCDHYLGYTAYEWLMEVRDIVSEEHCARIVVVKKPVCSGGGDPVIRVNGSVELVGLPGEEGYLIEALKSVLTRMGVACGEPGLD